jgi:hypothetical protein
MSVSKKVSGMSSSARLTRAIITLAAALLAFSANACKGSGPGTVDTKERGGDDGGNARGDAALDGSTDESGSGSSSGGSGSGSTSMSSTGGKADAGKKPARDGGARDAGPLDSGRPDECGGVHCIEPTVCDRDGGFPRCVCPPGYDFVDVGGTGTPCVPHCDGDCMNDAG